MLSLGQIRVAADNLAQQATGLYRTRATLWAAVLACLSTLGFILLDYLMHLEEQGLRWLFSLLWVCSLAAIAWYWLRDAWRFRLNSIEVAQWIETQHPELAGQLSNLLAADQLPTHDLRFGSLELRRAAVMATPADFSQLGWQSFVNKRPTTVAALACLGCALLMSILIVTNSSLAALGLQRMIAPWRITPWPRADQLEFVNLPSMIAINQELEVQIIDAQPPLPVEVILELKDSAAESRTSAVTRLPMRLIDDLATVTLPARDRDYQIRALGGDQREANWHDIRVAQRPSLVEQEFTIQPPRYTSQQPLKLVGQRIEVLAGSQVSFHGRFDIPVRAVTALPAYLSNTKEESRDPPPASITWQTSLVADGRSFDLIQADSAEAGIQQDQQWKLEVTTDEGLVVIDDRTWHVHVVTDQAPTVILNSLQSNVVTRHTELSITGQAADDLGLVEVAILTQTGDASQPQRTALWNAATEPTASNQPPNPSPPPRAVDIVTPWPRDGQTLTTGQRIALELEAVDSAGQKSKSLVQTIEVIDDQAMLAQMQLKQAEVFSALREIAQSQDRATHWLERTVEVAEAAGQLSPNEVETLKNALQLENSTADALVRSPDSIGSQLKALGEQLTKNHLADSPLAAELSRLNQQIDNLQSEAMQPAMDALEKTNQLLQSTTESEKLSTDTRQQLNQALSAAQKWSEQLNNLSQSAESVESLAEMQKQFQALLSQQQTVREQTEQLQVTSLTENNRSQLLSQRTGVRSDQQDLARNVAELLSKLDDQLRELKNKLQSEPTTTTTASNIDTLQRVREQLLDQQLGSRMQQAVQQIDESQLVQALQSQQASIEALQNIVGQFSSGGAAGLEGSSSAMENLSRQLDAMARTESALAKAFAEQAQNLDRQKADALNQQQRQLEQAIQQAATNSSSANSRSMREMLEQAQETANSATQAASQDQFQRAAEQAQQTADQLRSAQQQATQKAEQLREQLSQQQMYDLAGLLDGLVKRQTNVVDKLTSLPDTTQSGELDALHQESVAVAIADQSRSLQQLRESTGESQIPAAFAWLLKQCEAELIRSIAALERQRVRPQGLASATSALQMFQAAQAALANENAPDAEADEAQASQQDNASDSEKPRANMSLPSLKLLREMQVLLNDQLNEQLAQSPQDPTALQTLAERQQALADQVEQLIRNLQETQQPSAGSDSPSDEQK